jgi:hypothetical protein
MIKVILAVSKPEKATPTPPDNVIRSYHFTVIQTGKDEAAVVVADKNNKNTDPLLKYQTR